MFAPMPQLTTKDGITLAWESFGDEADQPILLVMGLSAQMILWPDAFCEKLAGEGYRVIRFDNRDIGESTKLDELGLPNIPKRLLLRMMRRVPAAPYTLSTMASDATQLLDGLGIERAHVVGMSMGGMIAQTLAIEHPSRVRSLVSIASSPGDFDLPLPAPRASRALLTRPPVEHEAAIAHGVGVLRAISSPVHFDASMARALVERARSRSTHRLGATRQLAAILASPPRSEALRRVRVPSTVIHGRMDPLVPLPHGERTASAIPGAALVILNEMGHDLPRPLYPQLIAAIVANTRRA